MLKIFLLVFPLISLAQAQVGEILGIRGDQSHLVRNGRKTQLTPGTSLEVGDTIHSGNAHVTLLLFPKIQMGLVKGTELRITTHLIEDAGGKEKTSSIVDLVKGLIRVQVTRDAG